MNFDIRNSEPLHILKLLKYIDKDDAEDRLMYYETESLIWFLAEVIIPKEEYELAAIVRDVLNERRHG